MPGDNQVAWPGRCPSLASPWSTASCPGPALLLATRYPRAQGAVSRSSRKPSSRGQHSLPCHLEAAWEPREAAGGVLRAGPHGAVVAAQRLEPGLEQCDSGADATVTTASRGLAHRRDGP